MALATGIALISVGILTGIVSGLPSKGEGALATAAIMLPLAICTLTIVVVSYVAAAWYVRNCRRWCVLLSAIAIGFILYFPVGLLLAILVANPPDWTFPAIAGAYALFILSLLAAAVIGDWREQAPRRWLHWVGVIVTALAAGSASAALLIEQLR